MLQLFVSVWRSWLLLKNERHLFDFTEDSTEGKTYIFENLITMVWIMVEAHSAVPGTHILVAVAQLCSVRPQPVFQLSEASPSLVLLPWGRKKIISWLSSHQLIVADKKPVLSLWVTQAHSSSEETWTLISCLIIFCCHFRACSTHSINRQSSPKKFSQKSTAQGTHKTSWITTTTHKVSLFCDLEKLEAFLQPGNVSVLLYPGSAAMLADVSEYWALVVSRLFRYLDTGWK